jgi:hypothetical protein
MTVRDGEVDSLTTALRNLPGIAQAVASDRSRLSNLPYCVLSAIYSIGATQAAWSNVVDRYRRYYNLPPRNVLAVASDMPEPSISEFIDQIESIGVERFAADVLDNLRPTSSSLSAPLRSEAALEYARVLKRHGIDRIRDVLAYPHPEALFTALCQVTGQSSGLSSKWFFMNAGFKGLVKLDRHVTGFLMRTLRRAVTPREAESLFAAVCRQLEPDYPGISPRALDLLIWQTARAR